MKNDFYIKSQNDFDEMILLIKERKIIALDTEFTREVTYYPILSLIQIGLKDRHGEKRIFIVDCLCGLDLYEIFSVIADPKIIKILHSSMQDLQIFFQKSNLFPKSIFDTQIMAHFCDFSVNIGYAALVKNLFDKTLDKKHQRSDWQLRPLSEGQIKYAALDVFFLEEIYEKFCEILEKKNRVNWYLEEIENFIKRSLSLRDEDEYFLQKFSLKNKTAKQIAQTKNIALLREAWAKKINIPRQHLIRDRTIEEIVIKGGVIEDTYTSVFPTYSTILTEIQNILASDEELSIENFLFIMSEEQKFCYKKAKKIISKISVQENFSEQFLLAGPGLRRLVIKKNSFQEIIFGWRYDLFGNELKDVLYGETS